MRFIWQYIHYRWKAVNEHGSHSSFLSRLLLDVFYVKADYYAYKPIEIIRARLLSSKKTIAFEDFGASATSNETTQKKIASIAENSAKSAKYAQLLFRLVNHFQPSTILELGTSLGISTAYLASANKKAQVTTIEGSKEVAKIAGQNFKALKLKNINQIIGNFDTVLSDSLKKMETLDFAFFDGNHTKDATLHYFEHCLQKAHSDSVFIFDDIYWSEGMTNAWETIKVHPQVTFTIDLFFMGIVFFKTDQAKEHFVIKM